MSSRNNLIQKISDYLENRQKSNNFGKCKKCSKNVYWSTTKVASHIRSGHCKGASEEEVQKFKQEYVYETPKHLIHRSCVGKTPRSDDSFKTESDEKSQNVTIKKIYLKHESDRGDSAKRQKLDLEHDSEGEPYRVIEDNNEQEEVLYELEATNTDDEKEILFVTDEIQQVQPSKAEQVSTTIMSKEEKFINAVYPQFKGRTKLELIDEILDLQRRNELLQNKVKTYEDTINKLL